MINPDTFKNEAVAIRDIYTELEVELLEKMAKQLNKGLNLSVTDWKVQKLAALSKFNVNRDELIAQAQLINKELADTLESAFIKGIKESDAIIPGVPQTPAVDFFSINEQRLLLLTNKTQITNIRALTEFYGSIGITYQDAINRALAGVISGSKTLKQSVKSSTLELANKGVGYVTYGNGRKVNIASYMEMMTRTNSTKVALEANTLRNKEYGYELVYINQYNGCSDTCQPWQGRVYFDDTDGEINNTDYPSLSTAINGGLFHPNCKHFKTPFDPDIQDKPKVIDNDEELYDKRQDQRYIERNITKWKKIDAVSTGTDKIKSKMKVKEWQSKNRKLIKSDDRLRRDYAREQL